MSENLSQALLITLVGMSLVFAAILLLWGMMAVLVRLTSGSAAEEETQGSEDEMELRRRAAAAAVAVALEQVEASMQVHEFPLPPTATVSPWQALMRTRMLNKRGTTR